MAIRTKVPAHPKYKLGQNFLVDQNVLEKIVHAFDPSPEDTVVEIGAGTGALTVRVAPRVRRMIAVEIDDSLIPYLEEIPGVEVLHSDVRKVDLCKLGESLRILGNLPYYISSPILNALIEQRACISDMMLMFQEEVAGRILSPPSHHEYGMLSVVAQYYCNIERKFRISRNSFIPRPEIESRVLKFTFREESRLPFDEYTKFLTIAFSQRRKKLRNNLLRSLPVSAETVDRVFQELQIPEVARAENLSADIYEELMKRLK